MSALLVVVTLLGAGAGRLVDPCDTKCAGVVKTCNQQCEKNFPKAQADQCKLACPGAAAPCKEDCKKKPPEEK